MHSTSPGALPLPPHVAAELRRAWEARAPDDLPRTRHLERDGSPTYTNRLLLETSPYLRQHAHNPVDWFPWGDEAFELAQTLKRPVFLSVGYSTCHWCHVMEEESFEDLEVARFLNEHFVAVKVDREERPDVDAVYMAAVQAISGQGGWPMSVFLTPDRKPFLGGTYFPARDGDRGAHTGFLTLMQKIQRVFDADPAEVIAQAEHAAEYLRGALAPQMAGDLPGPEVLERASAFFTDRYDPMWGGTRGSPKFPSHLPVRFLMGEHVRTGDPAPLEMATHTLRRMAAGGLRDQVGGGFHRYSVDHRWLVPHFEKMLYDNALLTLDHVDAWRLTGAPDFEALARETLAYVVREMTSPEGAFYSAMDADSPVPGTSSSEEGRFFTWTPAEIHAVLDEGDARAVLAWYAVEPEGNFEGRSILHTPRPAEEVARELGLAVDRLEARITATRERLYDARAQRPPPLRDDKILAAWNGLMISAFARAAFAFGDPALARRARDAASFVLDRMRVDGRLCRTFKDGRARHEAMLEDYAFVVTGLLDLFEATWERRWFDEALALTEVIEAHYADPQGGWFRTPDDGEALLAREKPDYDGAEPTGSSVHVRNLLRLSALTTDDRHRQRADDALRAHARRIGQGALAEMLLAVQWRVGAPKEVAIVAPSSLDEAEPLLRELRTSAPRHRVVVAVTQADLPSLVSALPWLDGKRALQGRATAYVCERGTCQSPTSDPATLRSLLRG